MHRFIELEISSYALMIVIGIIVAVYFLYCRQGILKLKLRELLLYSVIAVVGMALGSRVLFVISRIPAAIEQQSLTLIWHAIHSGGFVFYGGLFGAILAVWIIGKVNRSRGALAQELMNYCVPAFPLFHFFGRIGCLLAGCCYGIPVEWGIVQPAVDSYARLPVQLFESIYNIVIVAVLMLYENRARKKQRPYRLLPLYLAMYAPFRFVNEFFRDDHLRGAFGPFSTSQWVSLIVMASLIVYAVVAKGKAQKANKESA